MTTELRLTPRRRAVLDVLAAATDHPTAHEVFERVRRRSPGIGFATVYRTLALLVASGHALELDLGDSSARYDANTAPHDHLVCDGCGRALDLDPVLPGGLVEQVTRRTGYQVAGYTLRFHGRCPDCRPSGTT